MKVIELDRLYDFLIGIGGCDGQDEWTRGWDDAINAVIRQVGDWEEETVMIVKFQKQLFGGGKVLVYDKKETICQKLPMTEEIKKLFGNRNKMYRKCTLDKDGLLHIGKEVKGHF